MKTCTNCGATMPDDVTRCTECGTVFAVSKASKGTGKKNGPPKDQPVGQPSDHTGSSNSSVVYQPIYIQQTATAQPDGKSKAVVSLVLGLTGLVLSVLAPALEGIPAVLGLLICIVGIVFGVKARNRIPVGASGRSVATAGLTFSIIGTVISGIMTLVVICVVVGMLACLTAPSVYALDYTVIFGLLF